LIKFLFAGDPALNEEAMTKRKLIVLACARVLGMSACAHEAWQPPATAHPADPAAEPGSFTPITSLERYRASEDETDPDATTSTDSEDENDLANSFHHRTSPW
jgi:hypothetical protein